MNGKKSLALWLAVSVVFFGGVPLLPKGVIAQTITSKRCGKCGSSVSITANVGDTCPECGAYWGSARYSFESGSTSESGYMPQPTPWQMMALWRSMMLQQKQLEKRNRLTARVAALAAFEDKREERRQSVYARLREERDEAKARYDPDKQASQFFSSAIRCEEEGDMRSARAYYNLIVRRLPNSNRAEAARSALDRLIAR